MQAGQQGIIAAALKRNKTKFKFFLFFLCFLNFCDKSRLCVKDYCEDERALLLSDGATKEKHASQQTGTVLPFL